MTNAITMLMTEHRLIEQVLGSLETFVQSPAVGQHEARQTVARYADFFRNFADQCHHGKEENYLFATLHRQGMPLERGPLAVMLHEHELGRAHVQVLATLGDGEGPLDSDQQARLRNTTLDYCELLRSHIMKEDNVLFKMALQELTSETLAAVTQDFIQFEQETMGEQTHTRLHALAESLLAAYPPAAGIKP